MGFSGCGRLLLMETNCRQEEEKEVFPGRREQPRVCGHSRVWVGAEEEGSRCGGCWVEQPGLLEEDGLLLAGEGDAAAEKEKNGTCG